MAVRDDFGTCTVGIDGQVATVTITPPARLEGGTSDLHWDLGEIFSELRGDNSVRVVVLTGAHGEFYRPREAAFYDNPSLVAWLYQNCPGGAPDARTVGAETARACPDEASIRVHRGLGPDDILLAVGGGDAGGHSAFFPSWSRGRSVPFVTKEVPQ